MTDQNLYAPPKAAVDDIKRIDCWRDGKWVVVPVGCDLPPRCIVCNDPLEKPARTIRVYWHSPFIYLLLLFYFLPYLIFAIIFRKEIRVSPGLCPRHAARRRWRLAITALIGAGAFAGGVVTTSHGSGLVVAALFLVSLLALFGLVILGRKVYPKRITKEFAWLGGCKEAFLASLE